MHKPRWGHWVVFAGTMLVASPSRANGAYSHIHISHLAVDALPEGPVRTLLEDPEMLLACEQGSMFPDSGYAADDPFGEFAHWEPFHEPFLQYLRSLHGGDFSSREAKTQIAFLLGVMSHGLADQIYDTTLLARTFEADGPENADLPVDQYADYFLVIDQGVMLKTPKGGPYPQLVHVLNGEMGRTDLTEKDLDDAMYLMQLVLGAQGTLLAKGGYLPAWNAYPFLGTHIYNEKAVGSLPWLAGPISELKNGHGHHARLLRIDAMKGTTTLIGRWPTLRFQQRQWLVADREGGILIVGTRKAWPKATTMVRIDVKTAQVTNVAADSRALAIPPVVDRAGYGLLWENRHDGGVTYERRANLGGVPGRLTDIGRCFWP